MTFHITAGVMLAPKIRSKQWSSTWRLVWTLLLKDVWIYGVSYNIWAELCFQKSFEAMTSHMTSDVNFTTKRRSKQWRSYEFWGELRSWKAFKAMVIHVTSGLNFALKRHSKRCPSTWHLERTSLSKDVRSNGVQHDIWSKHHSEKTYEAMPFHIIFGVNFTPKRCPEK